MLRPVSYVLCVALCMFLMVHVEVLSDKQEHGLTCARHHPLYVCVEHGVYEPSAASSASLVQSCSCW